MKSYNITIKCIDERDFAAVLEEIMELTLAGATSATMAGNFSYDGALRPYSATIEVSINPNQAKGSSSVVRQGLSKEKGLAQKLSKRGAKV